MAAAREAVRPVQRWMKVLLTNGASLNMLTPALKVKPFVATQDQFQHNLWAVKVAGADADAAERQRARKVDFSGFYKKYGGAPPPR